MLCDKLLYHYFVQHYRVAPRKYNCWIKGGGVGLLYPSTPTRDLRPTWKSFRFYIMGPLAYFNLEYIWPPFSKGLVKPPGIKLVWVLCQVYKYMFFLYLKLYSYITRSLPMKFTLFEINIYKQTF